MQKFLCTLSSFVLLLTTTTQIVACSNPFDISNILRVTLVTDGHTIDDNSFNQSTYEGALNFKQQFNQWVKAGESTTDDYKNKQVVVNYVQPLNTSISTLIQSYSIATVMNSKVTLASGFIQKNALIAAQTKYLKGKMRYILVDGDTTNQEVPYNSKNLAGIMYKAEQSGFLAGIAAICWLIAHAEQYGGYTKDNLKLSTFGGIDNVPGVVNYMYGFYWAIGYFNNYIVPQDQTNPDRKQMINWINSLVPENKNSPIKNDTLYTVKFVKLPNQFSTDFVQASNGSKTVNDQLLKNGANVIFAVSGPQTEDTIGAIRSRNSNAKIVGVDTDQSKVYQSSSSLFITSALKMITNSVSKTLWNAFGLDNETHKPLSKDLEDQEFHGDAETHGGKDYIGIANNKAITNIYQSLIDYNNFNRSGGILDQITSGWAKVAKNASPNQTMWSLTPDINPFNFT